MTSTGMRPQTFPQGDISMPSALQTGKAWGKCAVMQLFASISQQAMLLHVANGRRVYNTL